MDLSVGIAIPAYRNPKSLRECLHSVQKELGPSPVSIVVVDDSGDGRVAATLAAEFPLVKWIVHDGNKGFGRAATTAVLESDCNIVILLNDDALLSCDPRPVLVAAFADQELFGVSFRSTFADGRLREGAKRVVWRLGIPRVLHNPKDQTPPQAGRQITDYVVGGHGAFRRRFFADLHGMDDHFAPFYWEDVDLSFRARARGWHAIYADTCTVVHDGDSAIRAHHEREHIREIVWRNRLRFARRHGTLSQRRLLCLGRLVLWAQAIFRSDGALLRALRATKMQ